MLYGRFVELDAMCFSMRCMCVRLEIDLNVYNSKLAYRDLIIKLRIKLDKKDFEINYNLSQKRVVK